MDRSRPPQGGLFVGVACRDVPLVRTGFYFSRPAFSRLHDRRSSVIPAKAGIHLAVAPLFFPRKAKIKIKMDPGFRRDDVFNDARAQAQRWQAGAHRV